MPGSRSAFGAGTALSPFQSPALPMLGGAAAALQSSRLACLCARPQPPCRAALPGGCRGQVTEAWLPGQEEPRIYLTLRQRGLLCALASPHGNPSALQHCSLAQELSSQPQCQGMATARRISPTFSCLSPCLELPQRRRCRCPWVRDIERTSARGFVANGAAARLATGPLQHPARRAIALRLLKCNLLKGNRSGRMHPNAASKQRWERRHPISGEIHLLQGPQWTISFTPGFRGGEQPSC